MYNSEFCEVSYNNEYKLFLSNGRSFATLMSTESHCYMH